MFDAHRPKCVTVTKLISGVRKTYIQGDKKKTEPTFTAINPTALMILASYFRTVCKHH